MSEADDGYLRLVSVERSPIIIYMLHEYAYGVS